MPVLRDERAVGRHHPDPAELERLESENLRAIDDLAKSDRLAVEV